MDVVAERCQATAAAAAEDGAAMVDKNQLYRSMAEHPDTGPVMALLELIEPVDEFSRGVVLVRDCFSPNNTLRALSRRKLRTMLAERTGLMAAYETAVMEAAQTYGIAPKSWLEAVKTLPPEVFEELRAAYQAQVDALMKRPL
jgi:hypothetical protein